VYALNTCFVFIKIKHRGPSTDKNEEQQFETMSFPRHTRYVSCDKDKSGINNVNKNMN
jgi:hypothetical protein